MIRIIWTCWFQGRDAAPPLVQACIHSWERKNPGWEVRCLDAASVKRYIALDRYIDLDSQSITAAALSDIVRIHLLREFGGIWVDATLFCNRPLDEWLPAVMGEGFFAFAAPGTGRPLSSWFLAAETDNVLISHWARQVTNYWLSRTASDDYFWFHHLFGALCETDPESARAWSRVPTVSALGPQLLQDREWLHRPLAQTGPIDGTIPVFKLMHRLPPEGIVPGSLLETLLADDRKVVARKPAPPPTAKPQDFASLKVATENLGDHIQIIAGLALLARLGVIPQRYIDRDDEIASAPRLEQETAILLNGWFKTNGAEWPPHPKLAPLLLGFHIRLFQCPELVSPASLGFFRRHQPIGCRDPYTEELLRSHGIEAFDSNCLTLTLPRRIARPLTQTEIFVASRDARITARLPASLGPYTFVSHYSGSHDFAANMEQATALLETYRSRAKLIVTTLLHCALPAIAMGIPVLVFYPPNDERGHASDRERFSGLAALLPIHNLDDMAAVDWNPAPVDVAALRLDLLDRFYAMAARWRLPPPVPLGPMAPADSLRPS